MILPPNHTKMSDEELTQALLDLGICDTREQAEDRVWLLRHAPAGSFPPPD